MLFNKSLALFFTLGAFSMAAPMPAENSVPAEGIVAEASKRDDYGATTADMKPWAKHVQEPKALRDAGSDPVDARSTIDDAALKRDDYGATTPDMKPWAEGVEEPKGLKRDDYGATTPDMKPWAEGVEEPKGLKRDDYGATTPDMKPWAEGVEEPKGLKREN